MGGKQPVIGDKVVIEMDSELDGEYGRVVSVNNEEDEDSVLDHAVKRSYGIRINSTKQAFWFRRGDFKLIKGD